MPSIRAGSKPLKTAPSSASAALRAASTRAVRSGERLPRSMASSSARARKKGVRSSRMGATSRMHASTPADGEVSNPIYRAEVHRGVFPTKRAGHVDELARGEKRRQRARCLRIDLAPRAVGNRRELASQVIHQSSSPRKLPSWSEPAEGPPPSPCSASRSTSVMDFLGEQVRAHVLVELRIVASDPLEQHHRVLLLLVAVVSEDRRELLITRRDRPLVVPVDRLELFLQRDERR